MKPLILIRQGNIFHFHMEAVGLGVVVMMESGEDLLTGQYTHIQVQSVWCLVSVLYGA